MHKSLLFLLVSGSLCALPEGADIRAGSADVSIGSASMQITADDHSIIHWDSFSIGASESVRFIQPSETAAVLNRVVGISPSELLGSLTSNGQILLINPNGILFGQDARIDVGALIASTLDVLDEDFLSGQGMAFNGTSGSVINLGAINTRGDLLLISPAVENDGTLRSQDGAVSIAASYQVRIQSADNPHISISPLPFEDGHIPIVNKGAIEALQIELLSTGQDRIAAIDHSGQLLALQTLEENGEIYIQTENGHTALAGEIIAPGGQIAITGSRAHLFDNSLIDASSPTHGGTIDIDVKALYQEPKSTLRADALDTGDGGSVILWGHEYCASYGSLSAQGGPHGGNGGFIEVSSRGGLIVEPTVQTQAPLGKQGTFLIDPVDITISTGADSNVASVGTGPYDYYFNNTPANVNIATLEGYLATNNVTIDTSHQTGGPFAGTGTIQVQNNITWSAATTLTLVADDNIGTTLGTTISNTSTTTGFVAMNFSNRSSTTAAPGLALQALASSGGDIILSGTGSSTFATSGVNFTTVTCSGGASLTVSGAGGTVGVDGIFFGSLTTVENGTMTLQSPNGSYLFLNGGVISSTGSGDIIFQGVGSTPGSVWIDSGTIEATSPSSTGRISIINCLVGVKGTIASSTARGIFISGTSLFQHTGFTDFASVVVEGGSITATGIAPITIQTDGLNGGAHGLIVGQSGHISVVDGSLTINAKGANIPFQVHSNGSISSSGAGSINITGDGLTNTHYSAEVVVGDAPVTFAPPVALDPGTIQTSGTGGITLSSTTYDVFIGSGSTVECTGLGNIAITSARDALIQYAHVEAQGGGLGITTVRDLLMTAQDTASYSCQVLYGAGTNLFTIGRNLTLQAGNAASSFVQLGGSSAEAIADLTIASIGGNATLNGLRGDAWALLGSGNPTQAGPKAISGNIAINTIAGDLTLNAATTIDGLYGFAQIGHVGGISGQFLLNGTIAITATGSINVNGGTNGAASYARIGHGGQSSTNTVYYNSTCTLKAGSNINLTTNLGQAQIQNLGAPLTLVVDNQYPTSPLYGTGALNLGAGSLLADSVQALTLYTSERSLNTINANVNGVAFVPGPLQVQSTTEQWGYYYPNGSYTLGSPYLFLYKTPNPFVSSGGAGGAYTSSALDAIYRSIVADAQLSDMLPMYTGAPHEARILQTADRETERPWIFENDVRK